MDRGSARPITVIPTCADVARYRVTRPRPDGPRLVWVGSIGTWYRFDLAVSASRATGLRLRVLTGQRDAAAREARGDAEVGWVPHETLHEALHEGDVGLCLYKTGFSRLACAPTRFAEYLAAGMPVIVTPVSAISSGSWGLSDRDFTFVSDVVSATRAAAEEPAAAGATLNIGGGSRIALRAALDVLADIAGLTPEVQVAARQSGDVRHTAADISAAREVIAYAPQVKLQEGLLAQWEWFVSSEPAVLP